MLKRSFGKTLKIRVHFHRTSVQFVAKKQTTNYTNYHEEKREKLELFPPDKR